MEWKVVAALGLMAVFVYVQAITVRSRRGHVSLSLLYRCSNTGRNVQGWIDDPEKDEGFTRRSSAGPAEMPA